MVLAMEKPREDDFTDDLIEDYLDHLCAPLVGIVPYPDRRLLRSEAAFIIDRLARDGVLDGLDPQAATLEAIRKYGDSQELSDRFLSEWTRHRERGYLARRLGLPRTFGVFFFGQATLWALVYGPRLDVPFLIYLGIAPILAGVLTGRIVPTTTSRDLLPVQLPMVLATSIAALLALPARESVVLPLAQLLWWIPAGSYVAQATGALLRRHLVRFTPKLP